jgi:hypothetical protein
MVKVIQDIMRQDFGVVGDAQRYDRQLSDRRRSCSVARQQLLSNPACSAFVGVSNRSFSG